MKVYTVVALDKDVYVRDDSGNLTLIKVGDVISDTSKFVNTDNAHITVSAGHENTSFVVNSNNDLQSLFQENANNPSNLQAELPNDNANNSTEQPSLNTEQQVEKQQENPENTEQNNDQLIDEGHYHTSAEVVDFNQLEISVDSNGSLAPRPIQDTLITQDETNIQGQQSLFGTLGFISVSSSSSNSPVTMLGTFQGVVTEDKKIDEQGEISLKGGGRIVDQSYTGQYGTLSLHENGQWTYQLDNKGNKAQGLSEGDNVEEHFSLQALNASGSTISHDLVIAIAGTNDGPVLSVNPLTTTTGTLNETDADTADTHLFSTTNGTGQYGVLSVDSSTGSYIYTQKPSVVGMHYDKTNDTYSGKEVFEVKVVDNHGAESVKFISMNVEAHVSAPLTPDGNVVITTSVTSLPSLTDTLPNLVGPDHVGPSHTDSNQTGSNQTGSNQTGSNQTGSNQTGSNQTGANQTGSQSNRVTIDLDKITDSGISDTDNLTHDKQLGISGTTDIPFSKVDIVDSGKVIGSTRSDANGHYHLTTSMPLAEGTHTLIAQATAPSSVVHENSPNLAVTIDTSVNATDDTDQINEDNQTALSGNVLSNDDHLNSESVAATSALKTAHGVYTLNTDGSYTYTLDQTSVQSLAKGESLVDTLTYEVTDSAGNKNTAVLSTNILGTNDTPVVSAPVTLPSGTEDITQTLTSAQLLANSSDVDTTDKLSIENINVDHGSATIDSQGVVHFTPEANYNGQVTFTYDVSDSHGGVVHTSATTNLSAVQDTAIIGGVDNGDVKEDAGVQASGQLTISDTDQGEAHFANTDIVGSLGTLHLTDSGAWTYDLDNTNPTVQALGDGVTATDTITVKSADGTAHQIDITVNGTNDIAIISDHKQHGVQEDTNVQGQFLLAHGQLGITDVDTGEALFQHSIIAGKYGNLVIETDGQWKFKADNKQASIQSLHAGQSEQEVVTVITADGTKHDIVIDIVGTNDHPVIHVAPADSTGVVKEDVTTSASGQLHASDVDGNDVLTWHVIGATSGDYGNIVLDPSTGKWVYQISQAGSTSGDKAQALAYKDQGVEHFKIEVTDQHGGKDTLEIVIDVKGTNDNPVLGAINSQSITEDGTSISGQFSATDVDNHETATYSIATPIDGFTLKADGSYSFDPSNSAYQYLAAGKYETLTIPITVTDQEGASDTKNLIITVHGTADSAIISGTDTGITTEETQLQASGTLTISDKDAGQAHFQGGDITAAHGTLHLKTDGSWSYDLDNSNKDVQALGTGKGGTTSSLTDTIEVQSADGTKHMITVTVNGTNDGPVLNTITAATATEGDTSATTGTITSTDTDTGDSASYTTTANVAGFTLNANGGYTFDPTNVAYNGLSAGDIQKITIPVTVTDGSGGTDTQNLEITITGTNDKPVLGAIAVQSATEDGAKVTGTITSTDVDAHETAAYTAPSIDGFSLDPATGAYTFDPSHSAYQHLAAGQDQTVTIPVTVTDQDGGTDTKNLVISVHGTADSAIISGTDTGTTTEETQLQATGTLTISDKDAGQAHFQGGDITAAHGTLHLKADGSWSYDLDNSNKDVQALGTGKGGTTSSLTETIEVQSADGTKHSITVTVNGTNDGPVLNTITAATATEGDTSATTGTITSTDTDTGDSASYTTTANVAGFTLNANGGYTFDPTNVAYNGLAEGDIQKITIPVTVTDGSGGTDTQNLEITITGTNDKPVLGAIAVQSATEDGAKVTGTITSTDVDAHETAAYTAPSIDGFSLDLATGAYTFDPSHSAYQHLAAGQDQTVTILVTVTDQNGGTDTHNLVITVHGTNDAPVVSSEVRLATGTEDTAINITQAQLLANATDIDNNDLNQLHVDAITADHGSFIHNADGSFTFHPDQDYNGQVHFTYDVKDAHGGLTHTGATTTLAAVQDAAVITQTPIQVTEDTTQSATIQLGITDKDAGEDHFNIATLKGAHGSATIAADGTLVYTLDNAAAQHLNVGQSITDTITVTSADGTTHDVSVTINGSNDNPVIGTIAAQSATEGGAAVTGTITSTDVDTGDTATYSTTTSPAGFTLNSNGSYSLDPANAAYQHLAAGEPQVITVPVIATDSHTGVSSATDLVITITGTNDTPTVSGPVALPSGTEDLTQTITTAQLLANATDVDTKDALSVSGLTADHGVISGPDSIGNYHFTPDTNYNGQVDFNYDISDGHGGVVHTSAATTLAAVQDAAVIGGGDTGSVTEDIQAHFGNTTAGLAPIHHGLGIDGQLTITDADSGENKFVALDSAEAHGNFLLLEGGYWSYTIDNDAKAIQSLGAGESITDSIQVSSVDGTLHTIHVTINGTNDAPQVSSAVTLAAGTEDTVITILATELLANATDIDHNDVGQLNIANLVADHGVILDNKDGTYTFTPEKDYNGQVHFTYDVKDGHGGNTHTGATTSLAAVQDVAVIAQTPINVTEDTSSSATIQLSITDKDAGEDHFNIATLKGAHGSATIAADGTLVYTLDNAAAQHLNVGQSITDTITVTSADGTTHDVSVTINGSNDNPVIGTIAAQSAIEGGAAVTGTITSTDLDTGDSATYTTTASPAGFTLNSNGTYSLDPANAAYQDLGVGEPQVITVPVIATDSHSGVSSATNLVITITGTNDTPTVSVPVALPSGTEDLTQTITAGQLLANATDVDKTDVLTVAGLSADHGSISGPDSSGNYQFTPEKDYNGDVHFTYDVKDGHGGVVQTSATTTLAAVQDAAVITQTSIQVTEDTTQSATIQLGITDKDAGEDHFNLATLKGAHGSATIAADGTLVYTLDNVAAQHLNVGQSITDTITVTSADGTTHDVSVTIHGSNDNPVIGTIAAQSATEGGAAVTGTITSTDVDTGDSATYATTASPAGFTLNSNGTYSLDPANAAYQHLAAGEPQVITVPVIATDSHTGVSSATDLVITITGTNDTPTVSAPIALTNGTEDLTQTITPAQLLANATDIDSTDALSIAGLTANHGSISGPDVSGNYHFTPDTNYNGQVDFNYAISDGHGGVVHTSATTTLAAVQDAAVISGVDTGTATEDSVSHGSNNLIVSGQLRVADVDSGEGMFTVTGQSNHQAGLHERGTPVAGDHGLGQFVVHANGTWTFIADNTSLKIQALAEHQTIQETFTVHSKDGTAHTITVDIVGTNDAPTVSSSVTLAAGTEDTAVTLTEAQLLANASDVDNGETAQLSVHNLSADHGTITDNKDGTYTFTPEKDYNGQVHFTYDVKDGHGGNTHTGATTSLAAVQDVAVIAQTPINVTEDTSSSATIQLSITDKDAGEDHFNIATLKGAHGSATIAADGTLVYTLDNAAAQHLNVGQSITDTITVTSADGTTHDVSVTINGSNDNPVIGTIAAQSAIEGGAAVTGTITSTDVDTGDSATYTTTASPDGFTLNPNGTYSLDPANAAYQHLAAGEPQVITVPVIATDSHTGVSSATDLVITITGTNDTPTVSTPVVLTSGTEDLTQTITAGQLLANATDVDKTDVLTVAGLSANHGSIAGPDSSGNYKFTPDADYNGDVTFSYNITDSKGGTVATTAITTLAAVQDAAVISGSHTGSVNEGNIGDVSTATGTLIITDVDKTDTPSFPDVTSVTTTYGHIAMANGQWTYTLDENKVQQLNPSQTVLDHYTFTASDGSTQTVDISIKGTNDQPVIDASSAVTVIEGSHTAHKGQMTTTDVDTGDTATYTAITPTTGQPIPGFTLNSDGSYKFDATDAGYDHLALGKTEKISVSVTVTDAAGATAQKDLIIIITGTNDRPTVVSSLAQHIHSIDEDTTQHFSDKDFGFIDKDHGDQLDHITITALPDTFKGQFEYDGHPITIPLDVLKADISKLTFVPVKDYNGGVQFGFTVNDGHTDSLPKIGNFEVTPINDSPVVSGGLTDTIAEGDKTHHSIDLLQGALDAEGQKLTIDGLNYKIGKGSTSTTLPTGLSIAPDGHTLVVDATDSAFNHIAAGSSEVISVSYQVKDPDGGSVTQTTTLTVTGTNNTPTFSAATGSVTEKSSTTASGTITVNDADDGESVFKAATGLAGQHGTLDIDANGVWTYTLNPKDPLLSVLAANMKILDHITVSSADGTTKVVDITIIGTNDAPTVNAVALSGTEDTDYQFKPTDFGFTDAELNAALHHVTITSLPSATQGQLMLHGIAVTANQEIVTSDIPNLTFVPTHNFNGDVHFKYTVNDGIASSAEATGTLAIAGTPDPISIVDSTPSRQEITEDNRVQNSGMISTDQNQVSIVDPDGTGRNLFTPSGTVHGTGTGATGSWVSGDKGVGQFILHASGEWYYKVDNNNQHINSLTDGDKFIETLTIHAQDGTSHILTATVNGHNDGPQAVGTVENTDDSEGHAIDMTLPSNLFTDAEGDSFTLSLAVTQHTEEAANPDSANPGWRGKDTDLGMPSWLHFDAKTGRIWGTPPHSADGDLDITVTATDSKGATGTYDFHIAVTDVDAKGIAHANVNEDDRATGQHSANGQLDAYHNGQHIIWHEQATGQDSTPNMLQGKYGHLQISTGGTWIYFLDHDGDQHWANKDLNALKAGQVEQEHFTIHGLQNGKEVATEQVIIAVTGKNDGATINGTMTSKSVSAITEDATKDTLAGHLNLKDADHGEDQFTPDPHIAGTYGHLELAANGDWVYHLDNSLAATNALSSAHGGTETFTINSPDNTASHTITINVNGVDDPTVTVTNGIPVVSGAVDLGTTTEDTSLHFTQADLLANASDKDGDTLSIVAGSLTAQHGTLTGDAATGFTFTPDANYHGTNVGLSYKVTDGHVQVAGTATLDITAVNDNPIVASALTAFFTEDTSSSTLNLLTGATDIDADTLTVNSLKVSIDGATATAQLPPGISLATDGHTLSIDPSNAAFAHLAQGAKQVILVTYDISDG